MDLNELLSRHQTSLISAGAATCAEARLAHEGLAELYAEQIRATQSDSGLSAGHLIAPAHSQISYQPTSRLDRFEDVMPTPPIMGS